MSVHSGSRQILIHGMVLVLFGLVWGLVVPNTPHPRLALGAHIQFETNGMLFIVLATLLLALPHSVGFKSVWVMVVAVWLTWAMALVSAGHETRPHWITDAELDARPELVKTMSVAPPRGEGRVRLLEIPGIDLQACGGTHVANTAEIGLLKVIKIRSEGKRNKRVTLELA